MIRYAVLAALLPVALTVATHRLVAGWPLPSDFSQFGIGGFGIGEFAIGPIDHVGPLEFAGLRDAGAFALQLAAFALVYLILPIAAGGRERLSRTAFFAFGLFLGGGATNSVEVLFRRAAMDWLWIRGDGPVALVTNWADIAIFLGIAILIPYIVWPSREQRVLDR